MRLVLAAILALSAAPAVADKSESCAQFGEMTDRAVSLRSTGESSESEAAEQLAAAYRDAGGEIAALAPQVVAWVWGLPQDQLGPQVGEAMTAQCMAG